MVFFFYGEIDYIQHYTMFLYSSITISIPETQQDLILFYGYPYLTCYVTLQLLQYVTDEPLDLTKLFSDPRNYIPQHLILCNKLDISSSTSSLKRKNLINKLIQQ
jgi:hypothetical protein